MNPDEKIEESIRVWRMWTYRLMIIFVIILGLGLLGIKWY